MTLTPSPYLRITGDSLDDAATHSVSRTAQLLLDGELDYETTPDLEAAVGELMASRPGLRELRLDCGRIQFCDTIGLAGLLSIRRGADRAGVRLVIANRTALLERLLEITGILAHLTRPLDLDGPANLDGASGFGGTGSARSSRPG